MKPATTDATSTPPPTRYRREQANLPGPANAGSARSVFSADKLDSILKTVPPDTIVRLDYGETFSVRLAWYLTGGESIHEGTLPEVTTLVAPHESTGIAVSSASEPE